MSEKGYVGRISNAGAQKVEAPYAKKSPKGKNKVTSGNDLRTGKDKK